MRGLTLEGGGAKGAFEIGAVKAFLENGYKFDGVTGTSIGALNGAMIAQGDIALAEEMWKSMEMSKLFPADDSLVSKVKSGDFSHSTVMEVIGAISSLFEQRGVDTEKIRDILEGRVNEEKLRASGVDFGLVTISVADLEAVTLFKERIPKGKLIDYLIASAMLPIFREDKDIAVKGARKFVDGSYFDSCPYNMLIDKGYDDIVVIRIFGFGVVHKPKRDDVKMTYVVPSEKLSSILDFTAENISYIMTMGYFDALRVIKNCKSTMYCIEPCSEEYFEKLLYLVSEQTIEKISELFEIKMAKNRRRLNEYIIPVIAHCLKLDEQFDYQTFCTAVLESHSLRCEIDRFKTYSFEELCAVSADSPIPEESTAFAEISPEYVIEEQEIQPFRLPVVSINSSYDFKIPDREKVAAAIEILVKEFAEIFLQGV